MKILLIAGALGAAWLLGLGRAFAGVLGVLPAGSGPDSPVLQAKNSQAKKVVARAQSGRLYDVWMWPLDPTVGVYTVAKQQNTAAWISYFFKDGKYIPVKTNANTKELGSTAEQRLSEMRADIENLNAVT